MKTAGIVCEYNPFHNGHLYHIKETRKICDAEYIIGVMSGDFTQRGEAAAANKYTRAKMALLSGCDMIIELPVRYATSSAEGFAASAVNILIDTGIVTDICFGSEDGNPDKLNMVCSILSNEPDRYSSLLKTYLKSGMSYPAARQKALSEYTDGAEISYTPNNILGIEYLRACKGSGITPHTIQRTDNGYLQDILSEHTGGICSSSAIRKYISEHKDTSLLNKYMPESVYNLLPASIINNNDFSDILYSQLRNNYNNLSDYLDVSSDIADRIRNNISYFTDYNTFIPLIKTRQITYTRAARALLHIMLGIKKTDISQAVSLREKYKIRYIRVLGFRKQASKLMKALSDNASVPVITRPSKAADIINDPYGKTLFDEDIRAADIYRHIENTRDRNEYTQGLIII